MKENLTSRKFLVTLSLIIIAAAVDILGKNGLSENLKEVIIYLGAVFMGGNMVEHVSGAIKTKFSSSLNESSESDQPAQAIDEGQLDRINNLESSNSVIIETIKQMQGTLKILVDKLAGKL